MGWVAVGGGFEVITGQRRQSRDKARQAKQRRQAAAVEGQGKTKQGMKEAVEKRRAGGEEQARTVSSLGGAESTTFLAPPLKCLAAVSCVRKAPVDSIT